MGSSLQRCLQELMEDLLQRPPWKEMHLNRKAFAIWTLPLAHLWDVLAARWHCYRATWTGGFFCPGPVVFWMLFYQRNLYPSWSIWHSRIESQGWLYTEKSSGRILPCSTLPILFWQKGTPREITYLEVSTTASHHSLVPVFGFLMGSWKPPSPRCWVSHHHCAPPWWNCRPRGAGCSWQTGSSVVDPWPSVLTSPAVCSPRGCWVWICLCHLYSPLKWCDLFECYINRWDTLEAERIISVG